MTDPTYDDESPRYPEVADRDARLVGHEWKGEAIGDDPKCEPGCISYYGGEKKHHRDCPYYPESLTKLNADRIEALLAERDALEAENQRLRESAERWEALVGSQRLRIMGAAGFVFGDGEPYPDPDRGDDWLHFGLEVWDKHPADPKEYPQDRCRALLTSYVDHRRAALKGEQP